MWKMQECARKENGNFMVVNIVDGVEVDFICETYHYAAEAQERADELNKEQGWSDEDEV